MAVDTLIYAQLSGAAYPRGEVNNIAIPDDWKVLRAPQNDPVTGFSAGVYRDGNGMGDNVVIAFTGTDERLLRDFIQGNIPAGAGAGSPQINQAMALVMEGI
jgi:hypothetical protein